MTKTTKILLAISLIGFAIGCTDLLWGMGRPVGAIFLGFFLISKLLEKEVALFDQQECERLNQAQKVLAAGRNRSESATRVEVARAALVVGARAS
jgi:hypothetical protein